MFQSILAILFIVKLVKRSKFHVPKIFLFPVFINKREIQTLFATLASRQEHCMKFNFLINQARLCGAIAEMLDTKLNTKKIFV